MLTGSATVEVIINDKPVHAYIAFEVSGGRDISFSLLQINDIHLAWVDEELVKQVTEAVEKDLPQSFKRDVDELLDIAWRSANEARAQDS